MVLLSSQDILLESDLVALGSLSGVLTGKHYNPSIRCHKVMYEALIHLLFQAYLETLPLQIQEETQDFIVSMVECYPDNQFSNCVHSPQLESLSKRIEEFSKQESSKHGTFSLWQTYIEMVEILLLFIRATRENNWELHLSAVRSMLPWFFVTDRVNYARWISLLAGNVLH
eukprot:gene11118-19994_t